MSQLPPQSPSVPSSQPHSAGAITPATPAKTSTKPCKTATLHPALRNALDCLDVDLDEELSRYRRHCLIQQRVARRRNTNRSTAGSASHGQAVNPALPTPSPVTSVTIVIPPSQLSSVLAGAAAPPPQTSTSGSTGMTP
ncbi:MAG: hypothetical protein F6K30_25680, partial [Cyanothece sp. SIO2G6]|nr:hypothetical protein [Cyanothece sp. SIO2G6]